MVLPGYALIAQGAQIHIAAWPGAEMATPPEGNIPLWPRQLLLSRAFASQGGCYVILSGGLCLPEHIPDEYRELHTFSYTGDSCIIDPRGEVIAGPVQGESILTARASLEAVYIAKAACDTAGHYSRPDLLQLHLSGKPLQPLSGGQGPWEEAALSPVLPQAGDPSAQHREREEKEED